MKNLICIFLIWCAPLFVLTPTISAKESRNAAMDENHNEKTFNAIIIQNMSSRVVSLKLAVDDRLAMAFEIPPNQIVRLVDFALDPGTRTVALTGKVTDKNGEIHPVSAQGGGIIYQFKNGFFGAIIANLAPQSILMRQPAFFELAISNIEDVSIEAWFEEK